MIIRGLSKKRGTELVQRCYHDKIEAVQVEGIVELYCKKCETKMKTFRGTLDMLPDGIEVRKEKKEVKKETKV